ncbi:FAD:protein FMN transferase [Skermanella aerolata]|uniref:FAD:protein FMN transferase n=1 Tax=Skermanella aerolata TaxID=393310 RepID=A0A512DZ29_9PROT|nr:FAD:protein FMN transferase [Skermanella aerolata]GEO41731.1 FAD:protein FMN transferase [Skermanella aerolata]
MSIETTRYALNGPTMGTRWSALVHAPASIDPDGLRAALARAVDEIDYQMSTWKTDSDLMRMNAAHPGLWVDLPPALMRVLGKGLEIGRASNGAFDIGLGDLTNAWGFGPQAADAGAIRAHLGQVRLPAHDLLELDAEGYRARKHGNLQLDLSGIAKGYGVDRMMAVIERFGIASALVGLDGELRAKGVRADGRLWTVAIEKPDYEMRAPISVLTLQDAAVATSGDYRHWVDAGQMRLSHTMDARTGGPLNNRVASVTVLADTCMEADAWATALMVMGEADGAAFADAKGLNALYILRTRSGLVQHRIGAVFCSGI